MVFFNWVLFSFLVYAHIPFTENLFDFYVKSIDFMIKIL